MANKAPERPPQVGILTVSDRCFLGTHEDGSGPNLKEIVEQEQGLAGQVVKTKIVPDECSQIQDALINWCDEEKLDLILTTGGTGFAKRDVTPEATKAVLEKEAPGLALSMLMGSLQITPLAMLSRPACGTRGKSLIINLPGSKKGSQECYEFVLPGLRHAIQLLRGDSKEVEATHKSMTSSQGSHDHSASHGHKKRRRTITRKGGKNSKTLTLIKDPNQDRVASQTSPQDYQVVNREMQNLHEMGFREFEVVQDIDLIPQTVDMEASSEQDESSSQRDETSKRIGLALKELSEDINEMDGRQSSVTHQSEKLGIALKEQDGKRTSVGVGKETTSYTDCLTCDGLQPLRSSGGHCYEDDDSDNGNEDGKDELDCEEDDGDDYENATYDQGTGDSCSKHHRREEHRSTEDEVEDSCRSAIKKSDCEKTTAVTEASNEAGGDGDPQSTYIVFEFDPTDINPRTQMSDEPRNKKQRVYALQRPFGKSQRQRKAEKKTSKSKTSKRKKASKNDQVEYSIPVGVPLRNFLASHELLRDVQLKRGKRNVKQDLVKMQRQENALAFQSWCRKTLVNERCRYDDLFMATEKGEELRMRIKDGMRDQFVVAWYLWCSGEGNCLRKCGTYGKCAQSCKGAQHTQDRHNCSVLVTLKLFLSDLQTWKVTITGQHVPPEGGVTWQRPSQTNPKQQLDEELRDLIFTEVDRELPVEEIFEKLQHEGAVAGRNVNRAKIMQSVQRRKRLMRCPLGHDIPDVPDHHHDISKVARRPRTSPYPMISYEEAYSLVMSKAPVLAAESINCKDALGYILTSDVTAKHPLPPFRASIKDGYAVISSDGTGPRRVLNEILAGQLPKSELIPGYVIRVNTGAPVPDGADAIVEVEQTELLKESNGGEIELEVNILKAAKPGQDIRPIGIDIPKDQVILKQGARLGPSELGLLAAVGVTHVPVHQRPRVAVMSTGNELCEPHETRKKGHIFDSNRTTLLSALKDHGYPGIDMGIAKDTVENLQATLKSAVSQADVVISTGGVSMGEKDLLKYCLMVGIHAKVHFGRVFLKPGKPTTFATISSESSQKLFFALPGNPASAIVTFNLFVLPALRKMMGYAQPDLTKIKAKVTSDISLDPRPEFQRAKLVWEDSDLVPTATVTGSQMSSRLLSMSDANALLMLPPQTQGVQVVKKGSVIDALIIGRL